MTKMTNHNLKESYSGESQAHMKYLIFANKAKEDGKPQVARLFEVIAYAEQVHATNHIKSLGDVGTTEENLQTAINGENFEVEEMYPAYDAVAKLQNEKSAIRSIHYALEAKKIHAAMFVEAKQAVTEEKDIKIGDLFICPVCGYTVEQNAPDNCPVCGVSKNRFVKF